MNRPDAMDLDVAALLGVDAASFLPAPPRARRPAAPRARPAIAKAKPPAWASAAQRSPWLWVIAPLAAALLVGLGMSWRSGDEAPPAQTAAQAVEPEAPPSMAETPRAMSLRIIDGPREAPIAVGPARSRPRNIPMAELGPPPAGAASSHQPEPAPDASSAAEEVPRIETASWFSDQELAPSLPPPADAAPIATAP